VDDKALAAALRDLAEYGTIYVDTAQAVWAIVMVCPVGVTVTSTKGGGYRIDESKGRRVIFL
jgi:hypothetical protein